MIPKRHVMKLPYSQKDYSKFPEHQNRFIGAPLRLTELMDLVPLRVAQIDRHQDEIACDLAKLERQDQTMTRFHDGSFT